MAIAAVKFTAFNTTSGTSATATGLTATAGNSILVGFSAYTAASNGSAWAATRTGDTYTLDASGNMVTGVNRNSNAILSAPNVAAAANDLVVSVTNGAGVSAFAMEFSGLPTSSISDGTSPAILETDATTVLSNALSNTTADAVYVGVVGVDTSANPATVDDGAGWTDNFGGNTMTMLVGTTNQVGGMTYQVVSSVASRTVDWTVTLPGGGAGCLIAVYKASSAVATSTLALQFLGL